MHFMQSCWLLRMWFEGHATNYYINLREGRPIIYIQECSTGQHVVPTAADYRDEMQGALTHSAECWGPTTYNNNNNNNNDHSQPAIMTTNNEVSIGYNTLELVCDVPANNLSEPGDHHIAVIEQNCRPGWPEWTCIFGNVCGLTSTTLWFLVLLPQVWKNFRRKSVAGLSVLWATADFTASLVNIFFVFMYVSVPLYSEISSAYFPVITLLLLIQFWVYGHNYRRRDKLIYLSLCVVMWAAVITLQVISRGNWLEWFAIILWCVETFPQVLLNMRLQSTSGQSNVSVLIAMCGKTTDMCSVYILVLPVQYVVLVYFSSSVAYIIGLQVIWYYPSNYIDNRRHGDDVATESVPSVAVASSQTTVYGSRNLNRTADFVPAANGIQHNNISIVNATRLFGTGLLCLLLAVCQAGLIWHLGPLYGSFGPCCIVLVLSAGYVWFNKRLQIKGCINACLTRCCREDPTRLYRTNREALGDITAV